MGTRGAFGVVRNEKEKIGYNQFDSYPAGNGVANLDWIRGIVKDDNLDIVRRLAESAQLVSNKVKPTPDEITYLMPWADLFVSEQTTEDWYCLTHKTHGSIAMMLDCGYILDSHDFPLDSLFCEWAYILDLDNDVFEVYEGFQTEPHNAGRFADRKPSEENGYFPVKLIASWPLDSLPRMRNFSSLKEMTMTNKVVYPDVIVQLTGEDGNAFSILGACHEAFKRSNSWDKEAWIKIQLEMMSGDYDHLLQTAMQYFEVE